MYAKRNFSKVFIIDMHMSPLFLFEKLLEMILDFLHIGIYTEIWYLEFIRKMFEYIAQFLKIITQILSCRLQYNNPVYFF